MKPVSYSLSQRAVHWIMAALIFFNLIWTDGIEAWNRAARNGGTPSADLVSSANIHSYVGIAILALAALRVILRLAQGAPDHPEAEPPLFQLASKLAHVALYALIFLVPLSGIAKYYFGFNLAGDLHAEILTNLLWALIGAHVMGALAHKFYWKTDVLDRMTKGVKA